MKAKIFKVAFSIALTMLVSIGFAQYPDGDAAWIDNPTAVRDTVTVGATMQYWVLPDSDLNPTYVGNGTGIGDEATLVSYWFWELINVTDGVEVDVTIPNAGAPNFGTIDSTWNYIEVQFNVTSTDIEIQVTEQSNPTYGASCGSGTTSSVFINVLPLPTAEFLSTSARDTSLCVAAVGDPAAVGLPLDLDSDSREIQVTYTINAGGPVTSGNITGSTLDLTGLTVGDYVIVLTNVTDRALRKCNGAPNVGNSLTGTINALDTFNISVSKTPTTGAIYHIAN